MEDLSQLSDAALDAIGAASAREGETGDIVVQYRLEEGWPRRHTEYIHMLVLRADLLL